MRVCQVAYLFRHTFLKGLEPAAAEAAGPSLDYRFTVFRCLDSVCADGQLLMDLFVNFDCDPDRTDTVLLERMFKALNTCIANAEALGEPGANAAMPVTQRNNLRYAALKCMSQAMHALFDWHERVASASSSRFPVLLRDRNCTSCAALNAHSALLV